MTDWTPDDRALRAPYITTAGEPYRGTPSTVRGVLARVGDDDFFVVDAEDEDEAREGIARFLVEYRDFEGQAAEEIADEATIIHDFHAEPIFRGRHRVALDAHHDLWEAGLCCCRACVRQFQEAFEEAAEAEAYRRGGGEVCVIVDHVDSCGLPAPECEAHAGECERIGCDTLWERAHNSAETPVCPNPDCPGDCEGESDE